MPIINFGRLNLPLKAKKITKNVMAEFQVAVTPILRPSKATKCGGPLSCEFAIFQKTI